MTAMSEDLLEYMAMSLPLSAVGTAQRVSRRWNDALASQSVWRRAAHSAGYAWDVKASEAEARTSERGGWKSLVRRERRLERAWTAPGGAGLRVRFLHGAGHHWVPSILMDEASRELVTCSYDGTVRFWTNADAQRPGCFKVLTAGLNEGFSCVGTHSPSDGEAVVLAAVRRRRMLFYCGRMAFAAVRTRPRASHEFFLSHSAGLRAWPCPCLASMATRRPGRCQGGA